MSLPSIAELTFRPDGVAAVAATLRLSPRPYLYCHAYEDSAPIVSLTDAHVSVSLTVPNPDQVTAEDVEVARSLAAVVARYITELETGSPPKTTLRLGMWRREEGGAASSWYLLAAPGFSPGPKLERGEHRMRKVVTGDQVAQIYNRDPFAFPAWRAPVYRTPFAVFLIVQTVRILWRLARFVTRHIVAILALLALVLAWREIGTAGLVALVLTAVVVLVVWRWRLPASFSRWAGSPARSRWRAIHYRRRWGAVMTIGRLAPSYQGRVLLPVLGKVTATKFTDRVMVRLVSGQSTQDFANRAANLAHGFGAALCRVRSTAPGAVVLEFIRRDALAAIIPALPVSVQVDLSALPVGRCEDGQVWTVRSVAPIC